MIHSSRRDRKAKAVAEVLAMMPTINPSISIFAFFVDGAERK